MMVEGALAAARLRFGALLLGAMAVLIPCPAHADTDGAPGPRRDWLALEQKNATYLQEQKFTEWARERLLLKQEEPNGVVDDEVMEQILKALRVM